MVAAAGEDQLLRAGALTVTLDSESSLVAIACNGIEVVRRIAVVVRDRNWNTIPPQTQLRDIRSSGDGFEIELRVSHVSDELDFTWEGQIVGSADGTVRFAFRGTANSDLYKNRIGFVVLHPGALCAGQPCEIRHPDGSIEPTDFPELVAPHQPFLDVAGMTYATGPASRVALDFTGDIFETEDQRNWSDASYKTYSTPLELPFPVFLPAGGVVEQTVTVGALVPSESVEPGSVADPLEFTVVNERHGPVPHVGVGFSASSVNEQSGAALTALAPHHLRVDLRSTDGSTKPPLAEASRLAAILGSGLEVAVHASDRALDLDAAFADIPLLASQVTSWLVFTDGAKATTRETFDAFRTATVHLAPEAQYGAGTDAYLAELNRNPAEGLRPDFATFSLNPQVHDEREVAILQTPEAIQVMVDTARECWGSEAVVVTPVTLRPRFNPNATGPEPEPAPGQLPSNTDARQSTLFAAVWAAATLGALARAGVASVTIAELVGLRGLVPLASATARPEGNHREVYPLFHAVAEFTTAAPAELLTTRASHPALVDGVALRAADRHRVVIWNLSTAPQRVRVTGLGAEVGVRTLDESTLGRATTGWAEFRALRNHVEVTDSQLDLTLEPYAITTLEYRV